MARKENTIQPIINPVPVMIFKNDIFPASICTFWQSKKQVLTQCHILFALVLNRTHKVKGKNPETGRASTKTVYAVDETDALKVARQFKLLEPLKVDEVPYDEASTFELDEAREIGVFVPPGAKSPDVVASIQRYKNIDETTIRRSEWEYAASLGIKLSALDGVTRAKIMFREAHKRWRSDEQLAQQ